jgi:hypothetical protein
VTPTHATWRAAAVLLAAACLLPSSGCASAVVHTPDCTALPQGSLPDSAGSLTERDAGTYCLPLGGRVDIFLTAHPQTDRWQRPQNSAPASLQPTSTGIMTAPVGVTVAMLVATAPGTAALSSDTTSGHHWRVTLVVGPKR